MGRMKHKGKGHFEEVSKSGFTVLSIIVRLNLPRFFRFNFMTHREQRANFQ